MALTKVSTDGVKDDAITSGKIPANAVGASELADNAVDTNAIANNAVTAGKTSGVQTTINNNADNRLITGSGTANTLEAESNLIYDGLRLGINRTPTTNADYPLQIKSANATAFAHFRSSQSEGDDPNLNGGLVGLLNDDMYLWGRESSSRIIFGTNNAERMRLDASGKLGIGTTNPQANLHLQVSGTDAPIAQFSSASYTGYVGTAHADNNIGNGSKAGNLVLRGQTGVAIMGNNGTTTQVKVDSDGLKFNNDTAAANALDDYEEGSFSVTLVGQYGGNASYSYRAGFYTRIGRVVHVVGDVRFNGGWSGNSGNVYLQLPFGTSLASGGTVGNGSIAEWNLSNANYDYLGITLDNYSVNARITTHDGSNNNTGHLNTGALGNGRYLKFGFTYITS